ncbi:unnamed protein product [Phytomonas sp. Hart1]|nr:unnamed protein product [Phytomonas sp. Hart1]|eukprot:CCW70675.1 unnamed protein product [Phytomonas sp. isolate Hart1]
MDHVTQILRLERKDLRAQRDALREEIKVYKSALRYRTLIEEAKHDILHLTDEHRDLSLGIRCNERLLLMNERVIETGEGFHRLEEELRVRNTLLRRTHAQALRDAKEAENRQQNLRRRIAGLEDEVETCRSAGPPMGYESLRRLREAGEVKRRKIQSLTYHLQRGLSPAHGKARGRSGDSPPPNSGLERGYLKDRIAQMRAELARLARGTPTPNPSEDSTDIVLDPPRGSEANGVSHAERINGISNAHEAKDRVGPSGEVEGRKESGRGIDPPPWLEPLNETVVAEPDGLKAKAEPIGTPDIASSVSGVLPQVNDEERKTEKMGEEMEGSLEEEKRERRHTNLMWLDDPEVDNEAPAEKGTTGSVSTKVGISNEFKDDIKQTVGNDSQDISEEVEESESNFPEGIEPNEVPDVPLGRKESTQTEPITNNVEATDTAQGDDDEPDWLKF